MSTTAPKTFVEWLQGLPIPWLVGNPIGRADAEAWGSVLDQQVVSLKDAQKAHFPDHAPSDALPVIGGDRKLVKGANESDASFRIRLKTAWDDWDRAGPSLELLVQLHWAGFSGAVLVQQNGLAYSLNGAPTAEQDPTSLLTVTQLGTLGTPLHSKVDLSRSIPAGNPWWTFDSDTDFCSRFAILFPGPLPSVFRPAGASSPVGLTPADHARLKFAIRTWRPARATCMGVFVLVRGEYWDWPVGTWDEPGGTWGPAEVVEFAGA